VTKVMIPAAWCHESLDLGAYLTNKGYEMLSQSGRDGFVWVFLEEDLDAGQRAALAADLATDLNAVSFE
jgi:hypothetical protein